MKLKSNAWNTLREMVGNGIDRIWVHYGDDQKVTVVNALINDELYAASAVRSKKDNYVKVLGREIAAGRLLKKLANQVKLAA